MPGALHRRRQRIECQQPRLPRRGLCLMCRNRGTAVGCPTCRVLRTAPRTRPGSRARTGRERTRRAAAPSPARCTSGFASPSGLLSACEHVGDLGESTTAGVRDDASFSAKFAGPLVLVVDQDPPVDHHGQAAGKPRAAGRGRQRGREDVHVDRGRLARPGRRGDRSGHRPLSSTVSSSLSCQPNGVWPPLTAAKNFAKSPDARSRSASGGRLMSATRVPSGTSKGISRPPPRWRLCPIAWIVRGRQGCRATGMPCTGARPRAR